MAITLVSINYRSATRVRLFFSEAVGAGAFGTTHYSVDSADSLGVDPQVSAALLVPDSPQVVELALGAALVDSGQYVVTCTAVPSATAGTFTGSLAFAAPGKPSSPSAGISALDIGAILYGEDLVWDGNDIAEAPNGDLATVSGQANALGAIKRAILANGLPWDPEHGGQLREFVDAPEPSLAAMVGRVKRTIEKDDRVKRSEVKVDSFANGNAFIDARGVLIGDDPFNVKADVPRSA